MNSRTEELKRKVLIVRVIAAISLVLIISVTLFFQWLGSDAGTVGKVEFSLKNDHSQRNVLECLDTAARLNKEGKRPIAQQVEAAVDAALSSQSNDARAAATSYLELAKALQKQNNPYYACKYSLAALKNFQELLTKSDAKKSKALITDILAPVDEASEIAINSKQPLSKEQIEAILPLADSLATAVEKDGRDRIIDLTLSGMTNDLLPVSDSSVRCMFAKDRILARRGQIAELAKASSRSIEQAKKLQSETVLKKAPEPCLLTHLVDLARLSREHDSNICSKYLAQAEEIIGKLDRSRQNDVEQYVTADAREKMSEAYIGIGDKNHGLLCAREAASIRPLQDAASAACTNQLINALVANNQSKDAEPLAADAYKFYKSKGAKDIELQGLRGACVSSYFHVLVSLKKNSQAITLLGDEIKEQKKLLPGSVQTLIALQSTLADYYLKRSDSKNAGLCIRQIAECTKHLQGQDRVENDMRVIRYAAATKTAELTAEASSDAMSTLSKLNRSPMDQDWIDGLCVALDNLRRSDAGELYQQVLESLKTGFISQLTATSADAVALAKVVNELGTSGEAKTADFLRTEALDKLSEAKGALFKSHSMDFVVEGEMESAQYAEPRNAAKVYLDLAHSMLGKDNESASKNAYEALKIYHVLAKKSPELRESLLDPIEDASNVMVSSKVAPTTGQRKLCFELSTMEEDAIKKTGKGKILDLAFSPASKDEPLNDENLALILLRGEALARRGQAALLDNHIAQTKDAVIEYQKDGGFIYTGYLADLAGQLVEHQQPIPARRLLITARRILEEIPSKPPELSPVAVTGTKPGTTTGAAGEQPVEAQKPAFPIPEIGKQCGMWDRLAMLYSKAGDRPSAVACARRSVSLRPPRDAASGNSALILVDGLTAMHNYAEAEPVALDLYRFAKAQGNNAAYAGLRSACARRIFQIMKEQHKDAAGIAVMREELDSRNRMTSAPPLQTVQLYSDLANYYASVQDKASLAECIAGIRHCKSLLTPDEKVQWERSGMQRDLIALALRSNESRVAAEEVADLVTYRSIDRGAALKSPQKWWLIGLTTYKSGDQKVYKQVLDFLRDGYTQQLSRADADAVLLADILTELGAQGEINLAVQLREQAKTKLPEAKAKTLLSRVKGLPAEAEPPKQTAAADGSPAQNQEKPGSAPAGIPATKTEHRPEGGRLDASDD